MVLQVISINSRGLGDPIKRRMIFNYYRDRCNILCIQETHSEASDERIWLSEWGSKGYFSHGTHSQRGVCILYKKNINYQICRTVADSEGHFLTCEMQNMDDPQKNLTLCNIYAPNKDKSGFFLDVIKRTVDFSSNLVIIGDFNLVLDVQLDQNCSKSNNKKAEAALHQIMEDLSLIDIWRVCNPEDRQYSWMRVGNQVSASRIDFAVVSQGLSASCVNTMYLPGIKPDHHAFYLAIDQIQNE